MSRIRGIDAKVQEKALQTRRFGANEIVKKKNEDQSSNSKDDLERLQIRELLLKLPKLDKIFNVHKKIGEGTFSSVYLGSLRQHAELSDSEKRWFAIKHLVPTAHPARVEHELRCLQDMGGKDNVIGVELCLRHLDTIVFIMPYIPHRKFSEYVGDMDANELRQYMRALMVALRHVHSFGVIHRDVKPSNFLYDRENRRYLLVDFGLAQRLCPAPEGPPPPAHSHNQAKRPREEDESPGAPGAKRMALDLSTGARRPLALPPAPRTPHPHPPPTRIHAHTQPSLTIHKSPPAAHSSQPVRSGLVCACAGVGGVCGGCLVRAPAKAPRAGTQGFRPPEVLLKYPHQTTAVDMWASGIVLASALSARYPFFRASDDVTALAEVADLVGAAALERAAAALGRRVVMSSSRRGLCLRKLCARLRGGVSSLPRGAALPRGAGLPPGAPAAPHSALPCVRCRLPQTQCLCRDDTKKAEEFTEGVYIGGFPDSAFSLAARLLDPDPRSRLSAAHALRHPFLADT